MKRVKLICLPHAGGSATVYMHWKKHMSPFIELLPIELSGRGLRFGEALYEHFSDMVLDVYQKICSLGVDDTPYAIFGHSMGALLGYEVIRLRRKSNLSTPSVLFVSGRFPPHLSLQGQINFSMTNDELIRHKDVVIPEEIWEYESIRNMFLNILKADLKTLDNYVFDEHDRMIASKLVVMNGAQDIPDHYVQQWRNYTDRDFVQHTYSGGHFYLNEHLKSIIGTIEEHIMGKEADSFCC